MEKSHAKEDGDDLEQKNPLLADEQLDDSDDDKENIASPELKDMEFSELDEDELENVRKI